MLEDGRLMNEPLCLKNCQAIERGYDLDELAREHIVIEENITPEIKRWLMISFKLGFQKRDEMLSDKKFTEEEVLMFAEYVWRENTNRRFESMQKHFENWVNPQQTEWDVEIETEPFCYDDSLGGFPTSYKEGMPTEQLKFDKNGCLILKINKHV